MMLYGKEITTEEVIAKIKELLHLEYKVKLRFDPDAGFIDIFSEATNENQENTGFPIVASTNEIAEVMMTIALDSELYDTSDKLTSLIDNSEGGIIRFYYLEPRLVN